MNSGELRAKILEVKRWARGSQRAPHKPLLISYVIANYIKGHPQLFSYANEIDSDLTDMLRRFGPARKSYHASYPFWRLSNDGFWKLVNKEFCVSRKGNTDPPKSELIKYNVLGGFSDDAFSIIRNNLDFSIELIVDVLNESFPSSIVEELLDYLDIPLQLNKTKARDPVFRRNVLREYNYRCAVCGFDLRVDDIIFGIEAAHIKWKQFYGPCTVDNGLALCSIHHKALDKGVIGLTSEYKIKLSNSLNGGDWSDILFYKFDGNMIYLPRNNINLPKQNYIAWHTKEVFRN
jgi:putative restriction endonuclease